jgi:hypothetical protein
MDIEILQERNDVEREQNVFLKLHLRKYYVLIIFYLITGISLMIYFVIISKSIFDIWDLSSSLAMMMIFVAIQTYRGLLVTKKELKLMNKNHLHFLVNAESIYLKITDLSISYRDPVIYTERNWITYSHYFQHKNYLLLYLFGATSYPATIIDLNKCKASDRTELMTFVTSRLWKKN